MTAQRPGDVEPQRLKALEGRRSRLRPPWRTTSWHAGRRRGCALRHRIGRLHPPRTPSAQASTSGPPTAAPRPPSPSCRRALWGIHMGRGLPCARRRAWARGRDEVAPAVFDEGGWERHFQPRSASGARPPHGGKSALPSLRPLWPSSLCGSNPLGRRIRGVRGPVPFGTRPTIPCLSVVLRGGRRGHR